MARLNCTIRAFLWPLILVAITACAHGAERQKRVLVVNSFGSGAPPFTVLSNAFETAIKRELGADVELDQVSLDMARYAQPDMEEPFADFLAKRLAKWQPDLVVPMGAPAGQFVAKFRDRLFPHTPVLYTGMDKRTIPAATLASNATFVGQSFDFKGLVEDALQLDPQTKQIVVILGATPLELYWTAAIKDAFAPFAPRVKFTFVNDLSFEQMIEVVSTLPPHSFVLMVLLMRDASGVTHDQHEALARLRAVSTAPINGLYDHQVGLGIVGGRLLQVGSNGQESARVAARILSGETASSIPPRVIELSQSLYDWRELKRWRISESRLPPGSVVIFRETAAWERYRWHIIAALAIIVVEALLIFALLFQRRRRKLAERAKQKAQAEVEKKQADLAHVSRVAVLGELTAALSHEINQPLAAIASNSSAAIRFLDGPKPELHEVRDALSDISADSQRAGEIIRRLRDMLKRNPPDFTNVDLNDVIRSVARIVHSEASLRGVDVQLDLSTLVQPVRGDSVQLQQVMLNLMVNALRALSEPSSNGDPRRLLVRTKPIDGSKVLIEVRDSGPGIAPDMIASIFDPFITSKRDGLGMGLSICRTIIERHGGKIWAANNPGHGATFSITLPLAKQSDTTKPRHSHS